MISRDITANQLQPNPAIDDLRRYRRNSHMQGGRCQCHNHHHRTIISDHHQHRFQKWVYSKKERTMKRRRRPRSMRPNEVPTTPCKSLYSSSIPIATLNLKSLAMP
ncbi:unnamed protein product [Sphagnum balticum]